MRIHKHLFKSIPLAALLFTGFAAGGIAQDTSTKLNPEAKAPVILSTTPFDGELNVHPGSVIEIIFSIDMNEKSINESTLMLHAINEDTMQVILNKSMHGNHNKAMQDDQTEERSSYMDSGKRRHHNTGAVKGTISYSDKVAVFTPDEELKEGTLYNLTITDGVKSSGNSALESDHEWSFTTIRDTDFTYSDNDKNGMVGDEYSDHTLRDNDMHDRNMHERTMDENAMDQRAMHESAMHERTMDEKAMDQRATHERAMDATLKDKANMIDLGKAGQFVILAKRNINNGSESMISGHTGEGSVAEKTKKEQDFIDSTRQRTNGRDLVWQSNHIDTTSLDVNEAIEDMMSAYNDASMQNGNDLTSQMDESLRNNVLTSGMHVWNNSLDINSDVALSGDEDDVWLFKIGDDLTVHENTVFTLTNGAQAANVFWYVEGEVTIGKNAQFEGIILSKNDITLEKGAKMNGRMFSQSSITLDDNTVTEPRTMAGQTSSTNR